MPKPLRIRVRRRRRRPARLRRSTLRTLLISSGLVLVAGGVTFGYGVIRLAADLDDRLRPNQHAPRLQVFARPLELWEGQAMTPAQLVARLNVLGYANRPHASQPGQFTIGPDTVVLAASGGTYAGQIVRIHFTQRLADPRVRRLQIVGGERLTRLDLEAPLLTSLGEASRQKRRATALDDIPESMIYAVLAIEDRRFYEHAGVDPLRMVGALVTNLIGDRPYLVGGSTLTQQLVKNTLLTPEKTLRRKLTEQLLSVRLEQRLTKAQILELYVNEVYLGHRGSFAIHGVAEAARIFFGKDVANVSLPEAATIAGVIQAPQTYSPFRHPDRARARRDVVLQAMSDAGFVSAAATSAAIVQPLVVTSFALEDEAPYFVDVVGQVISDRHPELMRSTAPVVVRTTLDLHLQRLAQRAVRDGLDAVDRRLTANGRTAQAALIATNPRTGEILAFVGGRAYGQSQFNRATHAQRQPGSVFKPFVYLAAFERAFLDHRTDFTPATVVYDEPTTFNDDARLWRPDNYGGQYDGPITLRQALARSRNVAAVKVAEMAGYDRLAALWQHAGGSPIEPYPSIALGAFETTPLEMASAYGVLATNGVHRPLRVLRSIRDGGRDIETPPAEPRRVARPDATYLVTNMMRSVLRDGTAAAARAAGFWLDAAGKSGTTNDLRDAWFVGFTPDLLTVVWVGLDDNQPLGLSGSQAALPIWTTFMASALAGQRAKTFDVPSGVGFALIDPTTGELARPGCPAVLTESFLTGSEPVVYCHLHRP